MPAQVMLLHQILQRLERSLNQKRIYRKESMTIGELIERLQHHDHFSGREEIIALLNRYQWLRFCPDDLAADELKTYEQQVRQWLRMDRFK